ncbi:predicted protein [Naegleria gruberi]|uniref:Predicted protein n=1 Tax=Naegleria gruberi TaxID=5762 RepID=D2VIZ5_NAEGR|nr:uncharacterized protein NAEGRDRAFT_34466 [Naegleria gruberi]EFC43187.1 predicted protein [Naegleria gruberi]|eukprot:XP_002675931.1 predicted protein [Naegleria gruberi strain NEG-M]
MIIYKLLLLLNTERILFHQTFRLFDKDGDGYIGKDELLNTLRALGHEVTMNDMDDIMSEIQTHKKGVISFDEFCTIMKAPTMDTMKTLPTRRKMFDMFDLNKDGFLSVNEFKSVSSKLGIGIVMEDNEIRQLFNLVDTNKDGLISYDEFVRLFNIS